MSTFSGVASLSRWTKMAPFRQPKKSSGRVASVLGATMTEDIGQPSEKVRSGRSATVPLKQK